MTTDNPDSTAPGYVPSEPGTLLAAVNLLDEHVLGLTDQLTIQKRHSRNFRRLAAAVLALMLVAGIGVYAAVRSNRDNAVQNCENANETRAANTQLWTYVLNVAAIGANDQDAENLNRIKAWVAILYQPHDCDDLSREYNVPPPPDLTTPAP